MGRAFAPSADGLEF